jgi:hypothetical protein
MVCFNNSKKKKHADNSVGCSLTDQVLDLLSRDHQFESHKPQDY